MTSGVFPTMDHNDHMKKKQSHYWIVSTLPSFSIYSSRGKSRRKKKKWEDMPTKNHPHILKQCSAVECPQYQVLSTSLLTQHVLSMLEAPSI